MPPVKLAAINKIYIRLLYLNGFLTQKTKPENIIAEDVVKFTVITVPQRIQLKKHEPVPTAGL